MKANSTNRTLLGIGLAICLLLIACASAPATTIQTSSPVIAPTNVMQLNTAESDLPQGSIVVNKPVAALDKYKNEIRLFFVIFIILCVILIYLLFEIGRRRKIEAALAEQSKLISALVDTVPALVYVYDMETNSNAYSNRGIEQILGYNVEQVKEMGADLFARLIHPNDLAAVIAFQNKIATAADGDVLEIEYRMKNTDGQWLNIHSYESPFLRNKDSSLKQKIGVAIEVTAHKQAEEALRESEQRYKMVTELASDYIYKISVAADGKASLEFVTDRYYSITGRSMEEGGTLDAWSSIFHPNDLGKVMAFLQTLIATRQPGTIECRTYLASGQMRWVEIIARPEWDEKENRVTAIIGAVKDITARKQAEEALRENEERFRTLYDNATIGLYRTTPNGRILMLNPAGVRMLGYGSFDEISQRNLENPEFQVDQSRKDFREKLEREDAIYGLERKMIQKDGSIIFVRESAKVFRDENGKALYYDGSFEDITERKQAEEALRQSEAKFRNIIDLSPVPYALNDDEQNITYLNAAFIKTFGYDLKDIPILADWWPKAYPDPDYRRRVAETWQARLDKAKAEGTEFEPMEVNIQCKDGSIRTTLVGAGSLRESFKGIHLVIFYDITERKQVEEALAKSEAMLNRVQEVAHMGSWVIDLAAKTVVASDEAHRVYGISQDSMTLAYIQSVPLPEFRPALDSALTALVTQGKRYDVEFKIQRQSDGEIRDVHSVAEYNASSRTVIGSIQDITERKLAEKALYESEARFRLLAENSTDMISRHDTQGVYLYVSPACRVLLGYEPEELIGHSAFEFIHPDNIPAVDQSRSNIINEPVVSTTVFRIRRKNGQYVWLETSSHTIIDKETGVAAEIHAASRDITARKEAEEALQKSEALYRQAIEVAGAVPYLQSYTGHGTGVNYEFIGEGIRQITGYGVEEFNDNLWVSITEERNLVEELAEYSWSEAVRRVRSGDSPVWKCEYRIRARDGKTHWVFESAVELRDENGVSHGSIGLFQDITARKQAEEALRKSESLYRQAIEVAGAVPYLQSYPDDINVNYEFIGEGIRQITGYGSKEFNEHLWDTLIQESVLLEDLAGYSWEEAIRRVRSGDNAIWKCEHRIRARDGKVHWVFESAVELRNENGVAHGSIGLFQDITARKRAEMMREVLLEVTQGIVTTKELWDFLSLVHRSIAKVIYAENFFVMLHNKDTGLFEEAYSVDKFDPPGTPPSQLEKSLSAYVFRTGKPFLSTTKLFDELANRGEVELVGASSPSWLGVPLKTTRGTIGVMVAQDYDTPDRFSEYDVDILTSIAWQVGLAVERKQAEEALQESENLYRKMNQNSPLGMHFYKLNNNDQLIFVGANPAADKLLGVENSQFIGKTIEEAFPPLIQTEVPERYHDAAAKGTPWSTEQIAYEDKRIMGAFEVKAFQTTPRNMVAVFADITARKKAEEEIRKFNAELEQRVRDRTAQLESANKELEAFSYSVSHDLRAPLRGIDGWSQALLEDYHDTLDEQGRQYIDRVRSETQRMGHLIDDMLQLSRLTRAEMHKEQVDLSALAHTIIERLQRVEPQRQVKFDIQENLTAKGDAYLLESVLTNLLGNAFKFTGKRADAHVEFKQIEIEGKRAFFIRDNGAGFDMTYSQKLFGAFQRMHKDSEFPGTGIGLATVQRVIHRHGGEIWTESKVNEGATFYFTLPE